MPMQTQIPMPSPPTAQDRREFSVLVVDDDADIADSAREVIEHLVPGCHVQTADSCAHGLAAMTAMTNTKTPFDAVLVDYRMPGNSGLDFIRKARYIEPGIPAILMTAYGSIELAVNAINGVHVDGFLAKPIDAEKLAASVQGAIRRSGPANADNAPIQW